MYKKNHGKPILGHKGENPQTPTRYPTPPPQEPSDNTQDTTGDDLLSKCLAACMKANQMRTCQFLCRPIKAIEEVAGNPEAKAAGIEKAKKIIAEIEQLSHAIQQQG